MIYNTSHLRVFLSGKMPNLNSRFANQTREDWTEHED